jgi:gliding motility-associated lipoprotein GldB
MNKLWTSIIILLVCGCSPTAPDVSKVNVIISVRRFDQEFFSVKSQQDLNKLKSNYGTFYEIYTNRIIQPSIRPDSSELSSVQAFRNDKDIKKIYQETQTQWNDFSVYQSSIKKALQYYRYYFPNKIIPEVIPYFFGFNYAVIATDSAVCIALDQYLGKDYMYYNHLPDYIRYRKEKQFMIPDLLRGWAMTEFEGPQPRKDLLDELIFQGKTMYLLSHLLPQTQDSVLMGYTSKQMKFCEDSEWNIWTFFVEKKLLYSTNPKDISNYTGEAPFSAGMPDDSPGRTGVWLGWKIVEAYMKNNKNMTLEKLMDEHDYRKILNKSNYKPKK